MLIASSTIISSTWRGNTGQMPSILRENVRKLWVYRLQFWIMSWKKAFWKIFDKVGVKINDRDIESCHHVFIQGRTIVKFSHMKDCQQFIKV